MSKIYFYAEDEKHSRITTALIQDSGNLACALCFGKEIPASVKNSGANMIVWFEADDDSPEHYAKLLSERLVETNATAALFESTARGRELAAHVAGFLNAPMFSDASKLEIKTEGLSCEHTIYGGMMLRSSSAEGFAIATTQAGFYEREVPKKEVEEIERIKATEIDTRVQVISREDIVKAGVDLAAAPVIICAGLGISDIEDLAILEALAVESGGAVACTRGVAEDRGWFAAELYIGISGKILNPDLYLGVGVSGQIQHMYGIRGAKTVAAINTDECAPIVKSSDYALIGDYKEVAPALLAALKK
ncbi:MAG: electron transfer flavoprotein subunit alpha/FixB family protein [Coriobacteriia bacterium]|nr:electron transfer flavoprotein subunit alpha/FixB family protein [Coriobacteriia bacterium]MCL2750236.1 electron transfer flavoprotein subunit alpha/FixB family protein [Coriobacteriia bacterium]